MPREPYRDRPQRPSSAVDSYRPEPTHPRDSDPRPQIHLPPAPASPSLPDPRPNPPFRSSSPPPRPDRADRPDRPRPLARNRDADRFQGSDQGRSRPPGRPVEDVPPRDDRRPYDRFSRSADPLPTNNSNNNGDSFHRSIESSSRDADPFRSQNPRGLGVQDGWPRLPDQRHAERRGLDPSRPQDDQPPSRPKPSDRPRIDSYKPDHASAPRGITIGEKRKPSSEEPERAPDTESAAGLGAPQRFDMVADIRQPPRNRVGDRPPEPTRESGPQPFNRRDHGDSQKRRDTQRPRIDRWKPGHDQGGAHEARQTGWPESASTAAATGTPSSTNVTVTIVTTDSSRTVLQDSRQDDRHDIRRPHEYEWPDAKRHKNDDDDGNDNRPPLELPPRRSPEIVKGASEPAPPRPESRSAAEPPERLDPAVVKRPYPAQTPASASISSPQRRQASDRSQESAQERGPGASRSDSVAGQLAPARQAEQAPRPLGQDRPLAVQEPRPSVQERPPSTIQVARSASGDGKLMTHDNQPHFRDDRFPPRGQRPFPPENRAHGPEPSPQDRRPPAQERRLSGPDTRSLERDSQPLKSDSRIHPERESRLHPERDSRLHPQRDDRLHPQRDDRLHPQRDRKLHSRPDSTHYRTDVSPKPSVEPIRAAEHVSSVQRPEPTHDVHPDSSRRDRFKQSEQDESSGRLKHERDEQNDAADRNETERLPKSDDVDSDEVDSEPHFDADELPQPWTEIKSRSSGESYYFNTETGESSWSLPEEVKARIFAARDAKRLQEQSACPQDRGSVANPSRSNTTARREALPAQDAQPTRIEPAHGSGRSARGDWDSQDRPRQRDAPASRDPIVSKDGPGRDRPATRDPGQPSGGKSHLSPRHSERKRSLSPGRDTASKPDPSKRYRPDSDVPKPPPLAAVRSGQQAADQIEWQTERHETAPMGRGRYASTAPGQHPKMAMVVTGPNRNNIEASPTRPPRSDGNADEDDRGSPTNAGEPLTRTNDTKPDQRPQHPIALPPTNDRNDPWEERQRESRWGGDRRSGGRQAANLRDDDDRSNIRDGRSRENGPLRDGMRRGSDRLDEDTREPNPRDRDAALPGNPADNGPRDHPREHNQGTRSDEPRGRGYNPRNGNNSSNNYNQNRRGGYGRPGNARVANSWDAGDREDPLPESRPRDDAPRDSRPREGGFPEYRPRNEDSQRSPPPHSRGDHPQRRSTTDSLDRAPWPQQPLDRYVPSSASAAASAATSTAPLPPPPHPDTDRYVPLDRNRGQGGMNNPRGGGGRGDTAGAWDGNVRNRGDRHQSGRNGNGGGRSSFDGRDRR
ncbi:uncharacterized protein BJ171DRAFT_484676 [Polychytrium aggregatum]|uniref:uncharacterized protein n=1 Tax=Polychytrium aggregatum TaxID=110093 RepID=UPI0022FE1299|nr:uncharacterized protein BJ171DRAFT_484676 [Polychytrium aggregatum]KAI9209668.1 hypothetical protein BJ171DRAFT_484676 [Polychytrium aggregatum]